MSDGIIVRFGADVSELETALEKIVADVKGLSQSLSDTSQQDSGQNQDQSEGGDKKKKSESDRQKKIESDLREAEAIKQVSDAKAKLAAAKYEQDDGSFDEKRQADIEDLNASLEVERLKLEKSGMSATDAKKKIDDLRVANEGLAKVNAAKEIAADYEKYMKPVEGVFAGVAKGVLLHQKNLAQAVRSSVQSMLSSYISMGANAVTHWAANKLAMISAEHIFGAAVKTQATKNASVQSASQAAQTAATHSGVAARTAAEGTGDAGFFTRIGQKLAQWLGFETAKTTATTTESGTRAAEDAAVTAETIASAKAQAAGQIPALAATGAAAAMASVAAIPVIGWAMAPGVGQAHLGQAMGYMAIASAAGGWERVPYDGAMTELHKDEMVLPASVANTVRAASYSVGAYGLPSETKGWANPSSPKVAGTVADGSGGGAVTMHYSPNISAIDTRGARDFLDQHGRYMVDVLSRQQRNFAQVKK